MKKWFQFFSLLMIAMFLLTPPLYAQENEPTQPPVLDGEETTPAEPDIPASQEVEINEDNYRQFMELKDPMRQRDIIPENVFKPGSGLQKLDKLPEESQKHLRNQLREIIVQGDPWQPGDEDTEYPYTPSVAASADPSLEKQEKEAWGELVDSYHDRESQMYENSSGSQAAKGSEQGSSDNPENGEGSNGPTGQNGEGSQGQQAGQEGGNPDQSNSEGTYSLNGSNDPNADSTAGVSQNAMEFLQGLGIGGDNSETGNGATPTEGGRQDESAAGTDASSQAQTGQQDSSEQSNPAGKSTQGPARDPNAKSTAGTSQNAMEFLRGNIGQGENVTENGTRTSENNEAQGEQDIAQAEGQQAGQDTGLQDGTAETQDSGQQEQQASAQGDEQAEGEEGENSQESPHAETVQNPASSVPPASTSPVSSIEPEEESTAGASQNALEYLMDESTQVDDDINNQADTIQPEGTLTIQDLLNARGVNNATGTQPLSSGTEEAQLPDETKPDKDGDG